MSKSVVEVQVRGVAATSGGCAVFLGNEEKVFMICVDRNVGVAIAMFMQGTKKQRPLTHDLLGSVLHAFEAKVERVLINDLRRGTELKQREMIEIDARPSDCIAMAAQQAAPIWVSRDVWDQVEDVTQVLRKIEEEGSESGEVDRGRLYRSLSFSWAIRSARPRAKGGADIKTAICSMPAKPLALTFL